MMKTGYTPTTEEIWDVLLLGGQVIALTEGDRLDEKEFEAMFDRWRANELAIG